MCGPKKVCTRNGPKKTYPSAHFIISQSKNFAQGVMDGWRDNAVTGDLGTICHATYMWMMPVRNFLSRLSKRKNGGFWRRRSCPSNGIGRLAEAISRREEHEREQGFAVIAYGPCQQCFWGGGGGRACQNNLVIQARGP